MKKTLPILISCLMALSFILACASTITPAPPSAKSIPATPVPAASPASNLAPTASQDTNWSKVVEAAKKEGMLVFQNSVFGGDIGMAVASAFKERYRIRLELVVSLGSESIERIKTEKRSGQRAASLVQNSGLQMLVMKNDGLLAPVKDLPSLQEKDVWSIHPGETDPSGYIIQFYKTLMGPYINTKLIKPGQEPQSIFDFLKPGWKGQMVISDPRTGSGTYWYYTTL